MKRTLRVRARQSALGLAAAALLLAAPARTDAQTSAGLSTPSLVATFSPWVSETVQKRKGPPGFDLGFRFVGPRFDGAFAVAGVPHDVPQGEAFEARLQLTNIGRKAIRVSGVTVVGDGLSLSTSLLSKRVASRTAADIASFRVPPQSGAGSTYRLTVSLRNGDRHTATLSISPRR